MTRVAPAPTVTRKAASDRRWLAVARAAWLLVLSLSLAVLVPNLGQQFNDNKTLCAGDGCYNYYRRSSNAIQRQQTKWVVYGSVVGVGTYAGLTLLFLVETARSGPLNALSVIFLLTGVTLALTLIPISVGMAILRSHLWDIDLLIRRTLVYAALTALLALVYFGSVVGLQALFTALTGAARSELVTVLSTLAIAALFVPLRQRLQSAIDRRFYRRKYDSARTLAEFGGRLRDETNLDALSGRLLAVVDETMQPESLDLWLRAPD